MRKIFLIVIVSVTVLSFSTIKNIAKQQKPNFQGNWEWTQNQKQDRYNFSLTITVQSGNNIEGYHLAVSQGGLKIDYTDSKLWDHPSITGIIKGNTATITFESSFTPNKTGEATLTFIAPDKIEWKTVKEIDGENYFPDKVVLVRESSLPAPTLKEEELIFKKKFPFLRLTPLEKPQTQFDSYDAGYNDCKEGKTWGTSLWNKRYEMDYEYGWGKAGCPVR